MEKRFERDGLFWLQYGLALRDCERQDDALEKLRLAREAYPMEHTLHALTQQLLILAASRSDHEKCIGYIAEAKEILLKVDDVIESDDTYPVVTLAEGHTKAIQHLDGGPAAQALAATYANVLKKRSDTKPDDARLRESWERLFRYATTGTWTEKISQVL